MKFVHLASVIVDNGLTFNQFGEVVDCYNGELGLCLSSWKWIESIPRFVNGQGLMTGESGSGGCLETWVNLWHLSHFWISSAESFCMVSYTLAWGISVLDFFSLNGCHIHLHGFPSLHIRLHLVGGTWGKAWHNPVCTASYLGSYTCCLVPGPSSLIFIFRGLPFY